MLFYPNAEQRLVSKSFDKFEASFLETLSHPEIRAELGEIAFELERMHSSAFAPNIKNGLFVAPKRYKDTDNLAVVPLSEDQANNAYQLTHPLYTERPVRTMSRSEAIVSVRYGLELPDELDALFELGPPGNANSPALTGLRKDTLARTTTNINRTIDGIYSVTRPNLLIRNTLLDENPYEIGAIIAHETVHASDLLEDGPLYGTLSYGAATELRAYHVGAKICKVAQIYSPFASHSIRLDTIRNRRIGHTEKPFTADPHLMALMQKQGVI